MKLNWWKRIMHRHIVIAHSINALPPYDNLLAYVEHQCTICGIITSSKIVIKKGVFPSFLKYDINYEKESS
jgi:hypothetical protein